MNKSQTQVGRVREGIIMCVDNTHDVLGVKNKKVLSLCKTVKSILYYDGYRVGFNILYIYIKHFWFSFHIITH